MSNWALQTMKWPSVQGPFQPKTKNRESWLSGSLKSKINRTPKLVSSKTSQSSWKTQWVWLKKLVSNLRNKRNSKKNNRSKWLPSSRLTSCRVKVEPTSIKSSSRRSPNSFKNRPSCCRKICRKSLKREMITSNRYRV